MNTNDLDAIEQQATKNGPEYVQGVVDAGILLMAD